MTQDTLYRSSAILTICIVIMMLMIGNSVAVAQDAAKFGKDYKDDLAMEVYPESPESDAIYLFDVGDYEIDRKFNLIMKRHARIKVLTEEGKEFGNVIIQYWKNDDFKKFKAHTILPNGKKVEVKDSDVQSETDSDWYRKKFAFPAVEIGCILEFSYEVKAERLAFIEPWYFQHNEYTRYSRVSMAFRPGFSYNFFYYNLPELEPQKSVVLRPDGKATQYTWEVRDLLPVKEEPYMRTATDYQAAVHFQMRYYKDQYNNIEFIKDWPSLVARMYEWHKAVFKKDEYIEKIVTGALPSSGEAIDSVRALYEYVRDKIETTVFATGGISDPKTVIQAGEGDGYDKNLALVNMLRTAGFDAYPVRISTRSHGLVTKNVHTLEQFNYVLAYVKLGRKEYVFDTRYKDCPFNLVPTYNLVEIGLRINEVSGTESVKWIDLPTPRSLNMDFCETTATISESGDVTCTSNIRKEDYAAYWARKGIRDDGREGYIKDMLETRFTAVELDSFEIAGLETTDEPLHITLHYRLPGFATASGDLMYVPDLTMNSMDENILKNPDRRFPVDFATRNSQKDEVVISLPDGFVVSELPEAESKKMKSVSYRRTASGEANSVKLQRQYLRRKTIFRTSEYKALRALYDGMVAGDQSQLVLSRGAVAGGSE